MSWCLARLLARGQHAVDAQLDQGFQRFKRIARHVKGAGKGDAHRAGQLDPRPRPLDVHRAVRVQDADHGPVRARGLGQLDIMLHHGELESKSKGD